MGSARPLSVIGAAISGGIINFAINAGLDFLLMEPGTMLPIWGAPGVALDLMLTAFFIAFATSILTTLQTRRQIARGRVLAPSVSPGLRGQFNRWPQGLMRRSLGLGVLSLLTLAPLPVFVLWIRDVDVLDRMTMVALAGGFG